MVDIIILAVISIVLGIKLFSILGKDQDTENKNKKNSTQSEDQQNAEESDVGFETPENAVQIKEVEMKLEKTSDPETKLKILDPKFNQKQFITDIKKAYKVILESYATGDTHALSHLINIEMMRKFAYAVSQREENSRNCDISIHKLKDVRIDKIDVSNYEAFITVKFNAEIINYIEDRNGHVLSGSKTKIEKKQDEWVFHKNLRSSGATWKLSSVSALFA